MNYLEKLLQGAPVEWKTLGEIGNFYGGLTGKSKKDFEQGNAKYITYMNVFTNIATDLDSENWVKVGDEERQNKIAYKDILFTGSSETPNECGMTSVVNQPIAEDIYLNSFCFGFRFDSEFIDIFDPDFLKYLFRGNLLRREITRTANGVTRFNISKKKMEKIKIPIPPLPVQKEIARILDAFTAITSELTSELTLRQKQYQHYRDKLLTFGDEVEWKTLGEVCENLDSKRKPITSGLREKGDIPYYGASGIVDYVKDYIFEGDYLLVSEDGANLLARNTPIAFSISGKNWVNNHAHVLKFENDTERKFIEFYLNNLDLTPYISGAAQPKLNKQNLNSIRIPNLSLEAKTKIVDILDKFDSLTNSISEGLPKEIALRQKQYEYYRDLLLNFKQDEASLSPS
ncbi:restriction endonuclease subunit S [Gallibacterium anatis]|uniref:restriction endonuclease subunit S n=1 Tax=Gallibacterium anatis TaxID=750 RepID=UPI0039FBAF1A